MVLECRSCTQRFAVPPEMRQGFLDRVLTEQELLARLRNASLARLGGEYRAHLLPNPPGRSSRRSRSHRGGVPAAGAQVPPRHLDRPRRRGAVREIIEARECLSNPDRRISYDRSIGIVRRTPGLRPDRTSNTETVFWVPPTPSDLTWNPSPIGRERGFRRRTGRREQRKASPGFRMTRSSQRSIPGFTSIPVPVTIPIVPAVPLLFLRALRRRAQGSGWPRSVPQSAAGGCVASSAGAGGCRSLAPQQEALSVLQSAGVFPLQEAACPRRLGGGVPSSTWGGVPSSTGGAVGSSTGGWVGSSIGMGVGSSIGTGVGSSTGAGGCSCTGGASDSCWRSRGGRAGAAARPAPARAARRGLRGSQRHRRSGSQRGETGQPFAWTALICSSMNRCY